MVFEQLVFRFFRNAEGHMRGSFRYPSLPYRLSPGPANFLFPCNLRHERFRTGNHRVLRPVPRPLYKPGHMRGCFVLPSQLSGFVGLYAVLYGT